MPLISVVMPVRNAGQVLRGIDSVLLQTLEDYEFVIVDDGSTDGTAAKLAWYAARDERVRILTLPKPVGIPSALNAGIRRSNASYVARMDVDDVAHPERLQRQYEFLEAHPIVDVLSSNFMQYYEDTGERRVVTLPETHDAIQRRLSYTTAICHAGVMIRRRCFQQFGYYNEKFLRSQDYELWMRWRRDVTFWNLQEELMTVYSLKRWHSLRGTTKAAILKWQLAIRFDSMCKPGFRFRDAVGLGRLLLAQVKDRSTVRSEREMILPDKRA
jgi:glycosyltransferase involved in cell wall biosynthesis